jgi:riboflavin synthase
MFTGLIEAICRVISVRRSSIAMELTIDLGKLANDSKVGDSIAINGVCLTITRLDGSSATFDASAETLAKSTIGKLGPSSQVNVERAMKATERFGGHFVLGHIDETATIKQIDKHGDFADIFFSAGPEVLDQMVVKGSVAIDGISLTIANVDDNCFSVALIPETLGKTTLGKAKNGDTVNIETDIIVKIIRKQLDKILPKEQKITMEQLLRLGF